MEYNTIYVGFFLKIDMHVCKTNECLYICERVTIDHF